MHPILLTIVALGINGGDPAQTAKVAPHVHEPGCETCGPAGHPAHGLAAHRELKKALKAQHNMMPQSCYDPTFGCYRGSRFMHRYPAFHGTYYRRPYNYRQVFEYPWHADLHEPTSQFSYNVPGRQALPVEAEEATPARPIQPSTPVEERELERSTMGEAIGTGVRPVRSASSTRAVSSRRVR